MMQNRWIKVIISFVIVGGSFGYLMSQSVSSDMVYYKHVDEVMQNPSIWTDKKLKLQGTIEPGSVKEFIEGQISKQTFVLTYNGARILVRSQGPKPSTFKELAELVAAGNIHHEQNEYVLYADELIGKCPSKYEEGKRTEDFTIPL